MTTAYTASPTVTPIRRVIVPTVRVRWGKWEVGFLLALGVLAAGAFAGEMWLQATNQPVPRPPSVVNWLLLLNFTAMFVVVLAWAAFAERRRKMLRQAVCANRLRRLERVLASAEGRRRFPHRLVEAAVLKPWAGLVKRDRRVLSGHELTLAPVIGELPAGQVFAITERDARRPSDPLMIDAPFEPIDTRDKRTIRELLIRAWQKRPPCLLSDEDEARLAGIVVKESYGPTKPPQDFTVRPALGCVIGLVALLAFLIAVIVGIVYLIRAAVPLVKDLMRMDLQSQCALVLVIGLIVAVFYVQRVVLMVRTLIVPGGIITMRHPFWRRRGSAMYARRDTTPLVWDVARRAAFVRVNGGVRQIHFDDVSLIGSDYPHVEAWFAVAPTPSVEMVRSFLGDDVELELAG